MGISSRERGVLSGVGGGGLEPPPLKKFQICLSYIVKKKKRKKVLAFAVTHIHPHEKSKFRIRAWRSKVMCFI